MRITVRNIHSDEFDSWLDIWNGYCSFYEIILTESVNQATWAAVIDAEKPILGRCVSAENGQLLGFSLSVLHPSTWQVEPTCYLEDLFVDPNYRGRGIGKALIDDLVSIARHEGWGRLYWHTNAANKTARRLYDRYVEADDFVRYRLSFR